MATVLGRAILDLAPAEGNFRNSEGAFITLRDGRIMFVYSRFKGDWNDFGGSDLARIYSSDGGESWSEPRVFLRSAELDSTNIMSVSMLRMKNGDIGLFFGRRGENALSDGRLHFCRSADEGESWSKPITCMLPEGYFVTNNDRVIRLSTGRILIPCSFHMAYCSGEGKMGFSSVGYSAFFASDNDGESFFGFGTGFVSNYNPNSGTGLQETGALELGDGTVWAWARTDLGGQYEFFSRDGGRSWSAPRMSRFTGPVSPLSAKRMPDGRLLAIYNPIPCYNGRETTKQGWGRVPLSYSISSDEGRNWSAPVDIESGPEGGYCYTAIHFTDDALLLGYCAGDSRDTACLQRLRITKIPLSELR